jgi:hypothetical protein
MLQQTRKALRVEDALSWYATLSGQPHAPAHEAELADRVRVRIDAEQAPEPKGPLVPAPIQFHAVRVAVDLDGHTVFGAGLEDRPDVHLIAWPAQQEPSRNVPENCCERVGYGLYDAGSLLCLSQPEPAVHARHHEIKRREHLLRVVQRAVGQDVGLDPLEDAKAAKLPVELVDQFVLAEDVVDRKMAASAISRRLCTPSEKSVWT